MSIFHPERLPDLELVGYLHRWCVIPRSRGKNQYLHHILSGDEPVFHDHPWDFRSLILSGGYTEMTPEGPVERNPGDVYDKTATDLHYIATVKPDTWTMIFTGPTIRDWGFQIDGQWIAHEAYENRPLTAITRNGYDHDSM
ncbi:MAG: hypothetical protein KDI36_04185 [Pseudomonadales bacterium]|nr:hypothetical protein [Pseudomonadales bacterium]